TFCSWQEMSRGTIRSSEFTPIPPAFSNHFPGSHRRRTKKLNNKKTSLLAQDTGNGHPAWPRSLLTCVPDLRLSSRHDHEIYSSCCSLCWTIAHRLYLRDQRHRKSIQLAGKCAICEHPPSADGSGVSGGRGHD